MRLRYGRSSSGGRLFVGDNGDTTTTTKPVVATAVVRKCRRRPVLHRSKHRAMPRKRLRRTAPAPPAPSEIVKGTSSLPIAPRKRGRPLRSLVLKEVEPLRILALGMSYPCRHAVQQVAPTTPRKEPPPRRATRLSMRLDENVENQAPLRDEILHGLAADWLTQMDARDWMRCVATEEAVPCQVYTVSQEQGAVYNAQRHFHANFNQSRSLHKVFAPGGLTPPFFHQVILDYFWIPKGWDQNHWHASFFRDTLCWLATWLTPLSSSNLGTGVVYLPFCLHVVWEVLAAQKDLLRHYNIEFLRQHQLAEIALWQGTQTIDEKIMQQVLGKRRDQENVYCTFGPREVEQAMDHARVSRSTLHHLLERLEDFADIRMIALRLLPPPPSGGPSLRSRSGPKRPSGQFLGLAEHPSQVKRGFRAAPGPGGGP
jgi:hypothetical protein